MKRPSRKTHGYYRKIIVPALREECGYVTDAEAHRAIKAGFYEMHPDDPNLPSMGKMTQEEAGRLIEYALIQAADRGIVLPDPRRDVGKLGVSDEDVTAILAGRK